MGTGVHGRRASQSATLTRRASGEPKDTVKFNISKEWCERSAKIEGDSEVGAGSIPPKRPLNTLTPEEIERLKASGMFHELYPEAAR